MPRRSASERFMSTIAAAPSEIELELAGVTVPSFLKAGFNWGIRSRLALNGCSSTLTMVSALPPAMVTGTTSRAKLPSLMAACARVREVMA